MEGGEEGIADTSTDEETGAKEGNSSAVEVEVELISSLLTFLVTGSSFRASNT